MAACIAARCIVRSEQVVLVFGGRGKDFEVELRKWCNASLLDISYHHGHQASHEIFLRSNLVLM